MESDSVSKPSRNEYELYLLQFATKKESYSACIMDGDRDSAEKFVALYYSNADE